MAEGYDERDVSAIYRSIEREIQNSIMEIGSVKYSELRKCFEKQGMNLSEETILKAIDESEITFEIVIKDGEFAIT